MLGLSASARAYRRCLAVLGMAVLFCSGTVAQPSDTHDGPRLERADLEAWMNGFFPFALQRSNIAGAVVVVVKDGRVLLQKGYGHADVARQIPMDPQRAIVGVGSVSKLLVWTAVMQEVERGRLDLDRDINDYLDFKIPQAFGRPITLRHLMTHTAGFADRVFKEVPEGSRPRELREYLKETPVSARIYPPGAMPAYSNYATMLAGYLVERVSGERFVDYMDRHVLGPLKMEHSTFRRPIPERLRGALAVAYGLPTEPPLPPVNEEPAGDPSGHLMVTASDMSHFMLAHLQQGRYEDLALLRPETVRLMHAPALEPVPGFTTMTLGFFQIDRNGHRIIGHSGDIAGFHADLQLLPEEGVGYFLAVNSEGVVHGVLPAANSLRTAFFRKFVDRYFPGPPALDEPTAPTAKEHARLAAGEYEMSRRWSGNFMEAVNLIARYFLIDVTIKADPDGTIQTPAFFAFENGRPQTWREVGDFVWREVGGNARLAMRTAGGKPQAFMTSDIITVMLSEKVPVIWSAALNVPLLLSAALILLGTVLLWPVTKLLRRHYGYGAVEGPLVRVGYYTRLAALLAVSYLVGWFVVIAVLDASHIVGQDHWIRLMQFVGLLCVAGAGLGAWNVWVTWRHASSWWAKVSSLVVALALLEIVWFSFAFHLISIELNY